jgi:hypothetical protein
LFDNKFRGLRVKRYDGDHSPAFEERASPLRGP